MSTTTSLASSSKCSHCGKDAKDICKGCKEDPGAYGENLKTYYCNSDCQKADWMAHKSSCLRARVRKDVYRIGDLLQQMFYTFKENVFDGVIGKVDEKNGKLRVQFIKREDQGRETQKCYPNLFGTFPFPKHLVKNPEDKFAVLTVLACNDAIAYTHDLAKYLLAGLYSEICEIQVVPNNPKRETVTLDKYGTEERMNFKHEVIQITLIRGAGQYILDLSGAQFGYHEPVTPITDYMMKRVDLIKSYPVRSDFGTWKAFFDKELQKESVNFVWYVNRETSKCLLSMSKEWIEDNKMTVKQLLKLDDGAYEASKKNLLNKVEFGIQALLVFMGTRIYGSSICPVGYITRNGNLM